MEVDLKKTLSSPGGAGLFETLSPPWSTDWFQDQQGHLDKTNEK